MKLKIAAMTLYAVAIPAVLLAGPPAATVETPEPQTDCDRIRSDDSSARVIKLNLGGTQGVVSFRHKHHETYLNPDSQFALQGQKGAECIGCHHKRTESTGVPILVKCIACHGGESDPRNPRNRDLDEVWSERAFHDLCIGCHRAANEKNLVKCDKAPVACSECHGPKS